jgi:MFS family permease
VLTGEKDGLFGPAYRLTTLGLLTVVTVVAFEAMAVATALPTAERDLHGLAHYAWAFDGFLVAQIVGMVSAGMLCDRHSARPAFVAGLALFATGLIVAGLADGMPQFVIGRVIQGYAAGNLVTATYVTIGQTLPERLRGKIMAGVSSAWVLPSFVGPVASGALTQHASWRWVFLGLVPLTAAAAALLAPQLRRMEAPDRSAPSQQQPTRLLRAVVLAAGLATLGQVGSDPSVGWLVVAPVAAIAAAWALAGLTPARTFRIGPGVGACVSLFGLLAGAIYGCQSFVPLALTIQHHYSATASGLPLLGSAALWAVGSWIQGRDRLATKRPALARIGALCVMLGVAGTAVGSVAGVPGWVVYLAWPIVGLGAGMALSGISVLLLATTTDADRGRDSSSMQLTDASVSALATAIGGYLVGAGAHHHLSYTTAFVLTDAVMVGLATVVALGAHRTAPPSC